MVRVGVNTSAWVVAEDEDLQPSVPKRLALLADALALTLLVMHGAVAKHVRIRRVEKVRLAVDAWHSRLRLVWEPKTSIMQVIEEDPLEIGCGIGLFL